VLHYEDWYKMFNDWSISAQWIDGDIKNGGLSRNHASAGQLRMPAGKR
jgi:hypothetical protein